MSARVVMRRMHNDGLITLPPPRNPRPATRVHLSALSDPQPPREQPAAALRPLVWSRVREKASSRLYHELIERYHYLGHTPLPGAQLRYLVYSAEQPIAALGFGAAAWMCAPRDQFIGWTHDQRQRQRVLPVSLHEIPPPCRYRGASVPVHPEVLPCPHPSHPSPPLPPT